MFVSRLAAVVIAILALVTPAPAQVPTKCATVLETEALVLELHPRAWLVTRLSGGDLRWFLDNYNAAAPQTFYFYDMASVFYQDRLTVGVFWFFNGCFVQWWAPSVRIFHQMTKTPIDLSRRASRDEHPDG